MPISPETTAGLPVPRPPAEIAGGDGGAVLRGDAQVGDSTGVDVTATFLRRAQRDVGMGVTAARLAQAGIRLFNERQLDEAARFLEALESEAEQAR